MLIQPYSFGVSSTPVNKLLRLGQYYQGGYVINLAGAYPNQTGLIIAPVQISSSDTWPADVNYAFPSNDNDGFSNTQESYNNGATTDAIGTTWTYEVVDTSTGILYSDWFLPAVNQLITIINNQSFIPYTLTASTYHSSTSFSPNPANQNFFVNLSAASGTGAKSDLRGVLAVRAIT